MIQKKTEFQPDTVPWKVVHYDGSEASNKQFRSFREANLAASRLENAAAVRV